MPQPTAAKPFTALPVRAEPAARGAEETAAVPPAQRALVVRLAEEVAALRQALDASRHRIAALEAEAAEDPATGLLNLRAFRRAIDKAALEGPRYRTESCLALIRVDGLAGAVERQGPRAAALLMRILGDRLRASIRSCDVAARLEPYQFAVLLWNAAPAECEPRLAAIRGAIETIGIAGAPARLETRTALVPIGGGVLADTLIERAEALLVG